MPHRMSEGRVLRGLDEKSEGIKKKEACITHSHRQ